MSRKILNLRWWFLGFCLIVILCLVAFLCSNEDEPVLGHKEHYIHRVVQACPHLPWHSSGSFVSIIKPAHSTSVGMGVDFENGARDDAWNQSTCETYFSVPCMKQPYHPGPWEIRLYKNTKWEKAVAWNVPCVEPLCTEPIPLLISFAWQDSLQRCIDMALPFTDFVAVDVRSNGSDVLLLEINGAFGMPYGWATEPESKTSVIIQHFNWIKDRISKGIYQMSIERILNLLCLGLERQTMKKKAGKIWF